ncbi:hypothetical protein [Algivirga pacifica]|uniref:Uncharacterized protein n=1 Tax=Algivirga pacifica TaxID=1162670 RepID=A0ABP9D636_9BACT
MIFPKAKKIARELGWHKTKNGVFGLYKEYLFEITDASIWSSPQHKLVTISFEELPEEKRFAISENLHLHKKELKFTAYDVRQNGIVVQFIENFRYTKIATVYHLMDHIVSLLNEYEVPTHKDCQSCHSTSQLGFYEVENGGMHLCKTCFTKHEKHIDLAIQATNQKRKNYLSGSVGAALFSIIGIIAWVFVAVYLGYLASAMSIVIGYLALKGYDYFKGKQGNLTKYIIVSINIGSIVIANLLTVLGILMNEGFQLTEAIEIFQMNSEVQNLLYSNLGLSFVLAFFVWVSFFVSLRYKMPYIRFAEKV